MKRPSLSLFIGSIFISSCYAWVYLSQSGDVTILSHTAIGGKDGEGDPRDLFVTGGAFIGRPGQTGNVTLQGSLILHHPVDPKLQSTSGNLTLHSNDQFIFTSDSLYTELNIVSYTGNAAIHLACDNGNATEEKRVSLTTTTANEFIIRREDLNGGLNMLRMVRDDTQINYIVTQVLEAIQERSIEECAAACSSACVNYCTNAPTVDKPIDNCEDTCNTNCQAECVPVGNNAQARTHMNMENSDLIFRPGISEYGRNDSYPSVTVVNSLYGDSRLTLDATQSPTIGKARLVFKSINESGGEEHRYAIETHPDGQFRIGTMDSSLNLDTILRIDSEHNNDLHVHYRTFHHMDVFQTGDLSIGPDLVDNDGSAILDGQGYAFKDRFVVKVATGRVGINVDVENGDPSTNLHVAGDVRITDNLRLNTMDVTVHVSVPVLESQPETNLVFLTPDGKDIELAPRGEGKIIIHGERPTIRAANTSMSDFYIEAGTESDRNIVIRPNLQGSLVIGGVSPTLVANTTIDITAKNIESETGSIRLIPPADREVVIGGRDPTLSSITDKPLTIKTPSENRHIYLDPDGTGNVVIGGNTPTVRSIATKPLTLRASETTTEGNVILRPSANGVVEIMSQNPKIASVAGKPFTIMTPDANANIMLKPHGSGSVIIGGDSPRIAADADKDLVLMTLDSHDIHLFMDGDGIVQIFGDAPKIQSKQDKSLILSSLPMSDNSLRLIPYEDGLVQIGGTSPQLKSEDGKPLMLQGSDSSNSTANIELIPSAGGVVIIGGAAPTLTAANNQPLTLMTTDLSSNIYLSPDGTGVIYLGGRIPTLRASNSDDDLRLESGDDGNIILKPGASRYVIIEGETPTLAAQERKKLVLATVSDDADIELNPHGEGRLVIGGLVPTITTQGKPLHIRSSSSTSLEGNIVLTTASGIVSINGLSPVIQAAENQQLVLQTISEDQNIVFSPHGQGRLLVGGNAPTITTDSKSLEIRTGTGHDLYLSTGDGKAVVVQDLSGSTSKLSSAVGNDLVLMTRSDNRDVVLAPNGAGIVKLQGDTPTLESVGEKDLIFRSGGNNTNIRLEPDGSGTLTVGGNNPTISSLSRTLTLSSQGTGESSDGNIYLTPAGSAPEGVVMIAGEKPTIASVPGKELQLRTLSEGMNIYLLPDADGHVVIGGNTPMLKAQSTPLELESGAGDGSVIISIPDGGDLVLDSSTPTISSVENTHLFLQTSSNNKSIVLAPAGSGQIVIGGDLPSIVSQSSSGLRLQGSANTSATGNVVLRHPAEGMIQIAGLDPTLAAIQGSNLTLRTMSSGTNILLSPYGAGFVEIQGTTPLLASEINKPLTLASGEGDDGDIVLTPTGVVVIGGANPILQAADNSSLTIRTIGNGMPINLIPSGSGVVIIGGNTPTIQAANETNNLWLQSGSEGNLVLVPGDSKHVVIEGSNPALRSTHGRELIIQTPSNDRDVILSPNGYGRVVVSSGNDQAKIVSQANKPLRLSTLSGNKDIILDPNGTGSVRVSGENPTVTSDVGKTLRLQSEDSNLNPTTTLGEIKLNSTQGIVTIDAMANHPTITTGLGQELHIRTQDKSKDIFIDPNGNGRVVIGGDSPVIASDDLQLELRSGVADDIILKAGVGKAVVISDSSGQQSVLTAVANSDLTLQTRTQGKDVVLNPYDDGNVIVGGTQPTLRAYDDRDLYLIAGGVDRNIWLVPNGQGAVIVGGSSPTIRATNNTLTLASPQNMSADISQDIYLTPAGNASVIIAGDQPTIQARQGAELIIRTVGNNANINLIPDGSGQVVIGGKNPTIRSLAGDTLKMQGGEGSGDIVLTIPGDSPGGFLIIDSNEPVISSVKGKDLQIITPSDNQPIHLTPNGAGHVVIGGNAPTVRSVTGKSLVLLADPLNTYDSDIVLSPGTSGGKVEIQGTNPTIISKESADLTLSTTTSGLSINLVPNGEGGVLIGGSSPQITTDASKPLTIQTQNSDVTGSIQLNPPDGGSVVIAGQKPTIVAQNDESLILRTTGIDSNIFIAPDGSGVLQLGGTTPTIRAVDLSQTLTLKSGSLASIVLQHGSNDGNAVIVSAQAPTIQSNSGSRLTLKTEDDDMDIVIAPNGNGKLLLESDVDHCTLATEDGKELRLVTIDTGNIVINPSGGGRMIVGGENPTISTDPTSGQPLVLSATSDDTATSKVTISSTDGILSLSGVNPTIRGSAGQDLTLSTESDNQDIRLVSAGSGRIVVVGGVVEGESDAVAVLTSDDQIMTLRSGAGLYLQPGNGYPVTIGDSNGYSELASADNQDLILRSSNNHDIYLSPDSAGKLYLLGDNPTIQAESNKNITIQGGGDSTSVILETSGTGEVIIAGTNPTITSATTTLNLIASRNSGSLSTADRHITISPPDNGKLIVGGATPTISSQTGKPLTLKTLDSNKDIVIAPDGSGSLVVGGDTPLVLADEGKGLVLQSQSDDDDRVILDAGQGMVQIGGSHPTLTGTPGKALTLSADPYSSGEANITLAPRGQGGAVVIGGVDPTISSAPGATLTIATDAGQDLILAPSGKIRVSGVIQPQNTSMPLTLSGGSSSSNATSSIRLDPGLGRYVEVGGIQPTLSSVPGKSLLIQTQDANKDIRLRPAGSGSVTIKNMLQLQARSEDYVCQGSSDAGKMWHYNGLMKYCGSDGVIRTLSAF